jgi:uncharacterized OB-fold protein
MEFNPRYLPDTWPLPVVDDINRDFFTSGRLRLQTCRSCGNVQHPPGEFCFACGSFECSYKEVPPKGTVSSFTIVHHPVHPMLANVVPYNVVVVQLDAFSHVHIVGNLVGLSGGDRPRIGEAVVGEWTGAIDDGQEDPIRFLQWRRAEDI